MIVPDTSDGYGQLLAVLMFAALLAYLAPSVVTLSPVWQYRLQLAAIVLLGAGIVIAVIATVLWFAG
jgi:hypothetical protein